MVQAAHRTEGNHPAHDGIMRSQVFPGLWLAVAELLAGNIPSVLTILQSGWQSPEHAAFVQKLANQ